MNRPPIYISHLKQQDDKKWVLQSNEEHEQGVAQLAEHFASVIGCGSIGKLLGLLHDVGKQQKGFQRYIRKKSGYDSAIMSAPRTPHAFVGALVAHKIYPNLHPLLAYPIASHHSGLLDYYDFQALMTDCMIPDEINLSQIQREEISLPTSFFKSMQPNDVHHVLRVLYSCLVDADYLDTEAFMAPQTHRLRKPKASLCDLLPVLEKYMEQLTIHSPNTKLNKIRCAIQDVCKQESDKAPGFYSLTVPTGGGKTLSSVLWAIRHAVKYKKERIIIAIPYTSIIVQTAATLRQIFGNDNVCEHHSSFAPENLRLAEKGKDELLQTLRLATENWDYPVIVTTNVQLFESMFSNKPSVCRKLHNLANSVLILDEVQTLPLDYLQPIVGALGSYQRMMGLSVLFTTASQPILEGKHKGVNPRVVLDGLPRIKEIIPSIWNLHDKLRRVRLCFDDKQSSYDEVVARLTKHNKVLCIVNTRKDAAEIFSRLPREGCTYHLSRRMCPAHIRSTIEAIRKSLDNPNEHIVRVVSTQLIEAGVDIDFPIVYRQESGLDSVLQAAGRCNREGKMSMSDTFVFKLNRPLPVGFLSMMNEARKNMKSNNDWFAPATMHEYFRQLYSRTTSFDKKEIVDAMKCENLKFKTVASDFRLIDNQGINIIVNYMNSCDYVEKIQKEGFSYAISQKVSNFMVNINQQNFKELIQGGLIDEILEGIYFLPDREQYREDVGLTTENHWLDEILIQ